MLTGTYIPVPVPYCIIITNSVPNPIFSHLILILFLTVTYIPVPYHCIIGAGN
jgi:hypothetical protein